MDDRINVTEILDVSMAPDAVRLLLERVTVDRRTIVIQEEGHEVAALISVADLERLRSLDRQRSERFAVIQEIHARNGDLDPNEAEQDIAEEIAAMRAEERSQAATPTRA